MTLLSSRRVALPPGGLAELLRRLWRFELAFYLSGRITRDSENAPACSSLCTDRRRSIRCASKHYGARGDLSLDLHMSATGVYAQVNSARPRQGTGRGADFRFNSGVFGFHACSYHRTEHLGAVGHGGGTFLPRPLPPQTERTWRFDLIGCPSVCRPNFQIAFAQFCKAWHEGGGLFVAKDKPLQRDTQSDQNLQSRMAGSSHV